MIQMRYQQYWVEALDAAHKCKKLSYIHRGHSGNKCPIEGHWEKLCAKVSENLGGRPGSLTRLHSVFAVLADVECNICELELKSWYARVRQLVDDIPAFSSLL